MDAQRDEGDRSTEQAGGEGGLGLQARTLRLG